MTTETVDFRIQALHYESVQDYPVGYPSWAAYQNSTPTFQTYKCFGTLRNRAILHQQQRLASLEAELLALDEKAVRNVTPHVGRLSSHRESESTQPERLSLINEIDRRLKEYDDLLERVTRSIAPGFQRSTQARPGWRNYRSSATAWTNPRISTRRTDSATSEERRNGLKTILDGKPVDAFGDTGSTENIVDEEYVRKRNLPLSLGNTEMVMGTGEKLRSIGHVELSVGFAREDGPSTPIIAQVVKHLPFDLLLSRSFLEDTGTLKERFSRFTRIRFPRLATAFCMNFLAVKSDENLFSGTLNRDTAFQAVLDTGSNCNVMGQEWALCQGLEIHTEEHQRGLIFTPNGRGTPTIGRVYANMDLPDGEAVPTQFEVLASTAVPVIIGVDMIFDLGLLTGVSGVCTDKQPPEQGFKELFHMDYRSKFLTKVFERAKALSSNTSHRGPQISQVDEDERRWSWDNKYEDGRLASAAEWDEEYQKRFLYERATSTAANPVNPPRLITKYPLDIDNHAASA